jgi:hypothetical protein
MSRLLARPPPRGSRQILRVQTAWYNGASDRLALEIRQAMFARHQATVERKQLELEREQEKLETAPKMPEREPLAPKPNSGQLLTYSPREGGSTSTSHPQASPHEQQQQNNLLPRRKLRALVSLYHRTATFITPETLDRHIEQEFAVDPRRPQYINTVTLRREVVRKNAIPEMTTRGLGGTIGGGSTGTIAERRTRRQRLAGALWGVDEEGNPDLEAVEEAIERKDGFGAIPNRQGI